MAVIRENNQTVVKIQLTLLRRSFQHPSSAYALSFVAKRVYWINERIPSPVQCNYFYTDFEVILGLEYVPVSLSYVQFKVAYQRNIRETSLLKIQGPKISTCPADVKIDIIDIFVKRIKYSSHFSYHPISQFNGGFCWKEIQSFLFEKELCNRVSNLNK